MSGIIANCHSALAISRLLVCFTTAMDHIPDTRTGTLRNKWQWHLKVVGGRCFCCSALTTLVTPLHRPGGANAAASVCLYRKQEMSADRLAASNSGPVNFPYPASRASQWSRCPAAFPAHTKFTQVKPFHPIQYKNNCFWFQLSTNVIMTSPNQKSFHYIALGQLGQLRYI